MLQFFLCCLVTLTLKFDNLWKLELAETCVWNTHTCRALAGWPPHSVQLQGTVQLGTKRLWKPWALWIAHSHKGYAVHFLKWLAVSFEQVSIFLVAATLLWAICTQHTMIAKILQLTAKKHVYTTVFACCPCTKQLALHQVHHTCLLFSSPWCKYFAAASQAGYVLNCCCYSPKIMLSSKKNHCRARTCTQPQTLSHDSQSSGNDQHVPGYLRHWRRCAVHQLPLPSK